MSSQKNKRAAELSAEAVVRAQRAEMQAKLDEAIRTGDFSNVPDGIIVVRAPQNPEMEAAQENFLAALHEKDRLAAYYRHHHNEAQIRLREAHEQIRDLMGHLKEVQTPTSPFDVAGREIGKIVEAKNKQYGDSARVTGDLLKALYPSGIPVEAYGDAMLVVRVLDKLCRISRGNEGEESAWKDIAGYGILGMIYGSAVARPAVQGMGGSPAISRSVVECDNPDCECHS